MSDATILVVDDDVDIARFIEINLRLEGFEVRSCFDGLQALEAIASARPDLVLLDVMMPHLDGVEVCRRLRADPLTATLPVIMLTAKSLSADKVVGLTAGADDYILKPFDTLELVARVRSALHRNREMRSVSPLTGLPGNHRIAEEIARRVAAREPFAVCSVDLDDFKAYNDAYGFLRGEKVISLLASALHRATLEAGDPLPFLGHVGGDDFVLVCTPGQAEPASKAVIDTFDRSIRERYDAADAARGYVEVADRRGHPQRYPLLTVSIGIAISDGYRFSDHRAVVAVATEMKAVAKRQPGSALAVDRRTT